MNKDLASVLNAMFRDEERKGDNRKLWTQTLLLCSKENFPKRSSVH